MGDPAGIGPEVIAKAVSVPDVYEEARLVVFGDEGLLTRVVQELAPSVQVVSVAKPQEVPLQLSGRPELFVVPVSCIQDPAFGSGLPVPASDKAQVDYIYRAFEAVHSGAASALVTGPVNKVSMRRAGVDFPGHTELLAQLTQSGPPVMMLAGPTLKVVPLTTHVPLRSVPDLLTVELVRHGIRVTHESFARYFGLEHPRVALAGLNPHAGEDGLFGHDEQRVLVPAIEEARALGIDVSGPHPADSVFHRAVSGEFDVVLGMYHDQALIPLKLLDFDHAVNVTLGLPIIRTSVDHGTAYDIAGRGVASAGSMIAALRLASRMVR